MSDQLNDRIARAKQLLEGTTPSPWRWECRENSDNGRVFDRLGNENGAALETQDPDEYESWVESSDEDMALIAAAPELAEIVASLTTEYIAEWRDNGVWAPIEMDGLDGTFANLRAAQGYIEVAKKQAPYEITRIVRRLVSESEVIE